MGDVFSYRGNPNLKRSGTKINFTKKQVKEYAKCKNDVKYFAEKYMKIVSLDEGLVTINLYDYQKNFLDMLNTNRFVAAVQCRQSGKCVSLNTFITVRNKRTGEINKIKIGEFYDKIKSKANTKEAHM